ncbi:arginine repressor [bacterium]|nr:arginine repressor [bacterium]
MQKLSRQKCLKEIIDSREAADQHDLLQALHEAGCETTQATVSRDLQEMGYVKVRLETGQYAYRILDRSSRAAMERQLELLFRNFVTDLRASGNLLIVKTTPGNANGVARVIDSLRREDILGTVAGDDTILIVLEDDAVKARVIDDFRSLLDEQ